MRDVREAAEFERMERVLQAMGDMIRPEYRQRFLETPHPLLNDRRPLDMLKTEEGTQEVIRLLEGAESGAFA